MKKIFLLVLAVAVLFSLPLTAQAKVDFELGGYIRMDAIWNSQQGIGHTLASYSPRDNVRGANHGAFYMNANATRLNLTLKGPELWGGKVTGFIEFDFDGANVQTQARAVNGDISNYTAVNDSQFVQAKIRLRHAMFKITYPDREFLFGQYWSVNSELIPETADSGGYCLYGSTQFRTPQVRYTQKFMDGFDASLEIAAPQSGRWGINVDANNALEGETAETPMVEAKLRFEQDFYGKAAWYGKPRAFYVGLGAGYFRTRNNALNFNNTQTQSFFTPGGVAWAAVANSLVQTNNWNTLGNNNFVVPRTGFVLPAIPATPGFITLTTNRTMSINNAEYNNHWLFLIENFAPIIPVVSKDLSGSLGLAHQWWVGQGVSAWRLDLPGSDRYYGYSGPATAANTFNYGQDFIKRYGGWAQLQYYFTNEIYTNLNFGFEKAFGFNRGQVVTAPGGFSYANLVGYDPINTVWRAGVTQWYRPVSAVKFALQYTWMRTQYFQNTTVNGAGTNSGNNHSLMANAWYMF